MTFTTNRTIEEIRAIVAGIRGKYITLGRDAELQAAIERQIDFGTGASAPKPIRFTSTDETRGIIVVDGAGGGKTSLVQRALYNHAALKPTEPTMPVVSISVPNPATMKSVAQEALKATGYPKSDKRRTAWEMWDLLRDRFQMLETVIFWIDEAHDLFPNGAKSEAPHILKTFKSLMQGDGAVVVILSGVDSLWDSISFDHQVQRRYSKFELAPLTSSTDSKLLWRLLDTYCGLAGLEPPVRGDLVERLIHAGRHRFGLCIEQVISAIEVALMRGDTTLDIQHLADAFFMQEACRIGDNVFLTPRWASLDLVA